MNNQEICFVKNNDIINVVQNAFKYIDKRLVSHGERVAYILYEIMAESGEFSKEEIQIAFILGIFHDIGAYKTEEINRMVEFETENVLQHSIYGYLFIKRYTPLSKYASAVLFHHADYNILRLLKPEFMDFASLIHLADRIDILIQTKEKSFDFNFLKFYVPDKFDTKYVNLFLKANENRKITDNIRTGKYLNIIMEYICSFEFTSEEVLNYLKMLVYSIDFRSENTVTHTFNTMSISMEIASMLDFSESELTELYYGALLHDIGKIAIPFDILEYPGKLNNEQLKIMQTHVLYTDEIIKNVVDDKIRNIAVRHHEKLDGSGYPNHLKAEQLSTAERIVAVADILSALSAKRCYKEAFSKEKTLHIINQMKEDGKLCPIICNLVLEKYDEIMDAVNQKENNVINEYKGITSEYNHLMKKINEFFNFEFIHNK